MDGWMGGCLIDWLIPHPIFQKKDGRFFHSIPKDYKVQESWCLSREGLSGVGETDSFLAGP